MKSYLDWDDLSECEKGRLCQIVCRVITGDHYERCIRGEQLDSAPYLRTTTSHYSSEAIMADQQRMEVLLRSWQDAVVDLEHLIPSKMKNRHGEIPELTTMTTQFTDTLRFAVMAAFQHGAEFGYTKRLPPAVMLLWEQAEGEMNTYYD